MTSWPQVESALNGILDRRWYTNHGPLARLLESGNGPRRPARKHADRRRQPDDRPDHDRGGPRPRRRGRALSARPARCAQALFWAGLQPVFCDVDEHARPRRFGHETPQVTQFRMLATPCPDPAGPICSRPNSACACSADAPADPLLGPSCIDLPGLGDDAGAACILTDDDTNSPRSFATSAAATAPVRPFPLSAPPTAELSEAQAAMALLHPRAGARLMRCSSPPRLVSRPTSHRPTAKILVAAKDASERPTE